MTKKIGFLVLNNFNHDARVTKQSNLFARKGYEVSVHAVFNGEDLPLLSRSNGVEIKRHNLVTKNLPKNSFFQSIKYINYIMKLSELRKFDYIFLSRAKTLPLGFIIKLMSFNKVVLIYDTRELETESNGLSKTQKRVVSSLERFFIPFTKKILVVSKSIQEIYQKKYRREVILIPNSTYFIKIKKNRIFHEKFNLSESTKVFLYQGRLTKGRGIEVIVNAFEEFKNVDIALVIMGHGELEEWVKKIALKNPNIHFHKSVAQNELRSYTASADYGFCLIENTCLSYYYSLPNKLFEYSVAGLPVIASDFPDMGSLVREFKNGVLIEDVKKEKIVSSINEILNEDYYQLSVNSKILAESWDWANYEETLINLVE